VSRLFRVSFKSSKVAKEIRLEFQLSETPIFLNFDYSRLSVVVVVEEVDKFRKREQEEILLGKEEKLEVEKGTGSFYVLKHSYSRD
jgi:hypothetical protein